MSTQSANRRNFILEDDITAFIDGMPRGEKSKIVNEALRVKMEEVAQEEANKRVLSVLDRIKPVDTGDNKTSVEAVEEARIHRAKQISDKY